MAKILIAGYGYIGQPLAHKLVEEGNIVYTISRTTKRFIPGIEMIQGDIFEMNALPDVDAVIYLISADQYQEQDYRSAYLDGPQKIWSLFDKKPYRFLFASSTAVYPYQDGRWVNENTPLDEATHFSGKILQEAEKQVQKFDCLNICMRIAGIYGPKRYHFLDRIHQNKITITANPKFTNMIHQADCVGAITHLLNHLAPEPIYNLVDNEPTPVNEIISWMHAHLGQETEIPSKAHQPQRVTSNKRVSNEKLTLLRYQFQYPSYRDGYLTCFENN